MTDPTPAARPDPAPDGIVVVDKPAGWTSHDVVARMRRLAHTRKVGHAGTLDPMATGVLLIGVGKATRLLGHLALTEKVYDGTIRLGVTTNTDDAEGEPLATVDAAAVTDDQIADAIAPLTGLIQQVPPQVSAIKVDGQRAYKRARAGEDVALLARPVTVHEFSIAAIRRHEATVDLDVRVRCSSGTYIRSLARDLGATLGVGGHLAALRRTAVGAFDLSQARTLDELAIECSVVPLADVVGATFPRRDVDAETATLVAHGGRLALAGTEGVVGVFGPDGLLALFEDRDGA
ncbi:MAG: tRNA pseudouridine55 synthase, partial [Frankiaceae bacterium]|nr:tRNA pseudouridine55 synthase [Frankiaceae bacterium]